MTKKAYLLASLAASTWSIALLLRLRDPSCAFPCSTSTPTIPSPCPPTGASTLGKLPVLVRLSAPFSPIPGRNSLATLTPATAPAAALAAGTGALAWKGGIACRREGWNAASGGCRGTPGVACGSMGGDDVAGALVGVGGWAGGMLVEVDDGPGAGG